MTAATLETIVVTACWVLVSVCAIASVRIIVQEACETYRGGRRG